MGFVTYGVGKLAYIEVLFPQNIRQHVITIPDNFILIWYPHRASLKNMPVSQEIWPPPNLAPRAKFPRILGPPGGHIS
jgi:hypothetical protein